MSRFLSGIIATLRLIIGILMVLKSVTLHGKEAIKMVEQLEDRELNTKERRVVELEGFVPVVYKDSKGIDTFGVGQTGEFINKGFKESFDVHENRTRACIKDYDYLPEYLQAELVQAEYRGDLGMSPKFRKLFNQGLYEEAAMEFLDHAEYKDPETPTQIKNRLYAVAEAVRKYKYLHRTS
jgi:GH24 family phage-related lysozyme (muramidase)